MLKEWVVSGGQTGVYSRNGLFLVVRRRVLKAWVVSGGQTVCDQGMGCFWWSDSVCSRHGWSSGGQTARSGGSDHQVRRQSRQRRVRTATRVGVAQAL